MAEQDEIKTQLMSKAKWLPPVENVGELPTVGVAEGTRCFVDPDDDEEEVWEFRQGTWVHMDTL